MKVCPACHRPQSQAKPHCQNTDRTTPCEWLHCPCGADIRIRDGKHKPGSAPGLYRK